MRWKGNQDIIPTFPQNLEKNHLVILAQREREYHLDQSQQFVSLRIMLKLGYTHVDCNSDGNKNIIPVFEFAKYESSILWGPILLSIKLHNFKVINWFLRMKIPEQRVARFCYQVWRDTKKFANQYLCNSTALIGPPQVKC